MFGVILFRAQPYHNGHKHMIETAFKECRELGIPLYIFIGSANKFGTIRNPLPIYLRKMLIEEDLKETYTPEELINIRVVALDDLSDEANNNISWGDYLYENIKKVAGVSNFIFYYSDKPDIILSWFSALRDKIYFKFMSRYGNYNATDIRKRILLAETAEELKDFVPNSTLNNFIHIKDYIERAR